MLAAGSLEPEGGDWDVRSSRAGTAGEGSGCFLLSFHIVNNSKSKLSVGNSGWEEWKDLQRSAREINASPWVWTGNPLLDLLVYCSLYNNIKSDLA